MKRLLSISAALAMAVSIPAFATSHKEAPAMAGASAPMTKQQSKMGDCNKQAEGKKGDERKAFMKTCLSAEKMSQQDKMKKCNADATGKKGDERKTFMKACLSS
ncbi:MAG: PsiF family protein [Caldimonas sp.]